MATQTHIRHSRTQTAAAAIAVLAAYAAMPAAAQTTSLPTISIIGKKAPGAASVAGFGDEPISRSPFTAQVLTQDDMKDRGVQRLSDLTLIDAAVSDSYNSAGYWDFLSVRGFVLDPRSNYRREGLPINAETSIALDNKERVELLKGTSGIQAGTSAPGGLVNYVVKRPDSATRSVTVGWQGANNLLGAVDVGSRFGIDDAFGLRVNAAYEQLDSEIRGLRGHRNLLAVAGDWRLNTDSRLEAEVEISRRSQPSQQAFSLWGSVVPPPTDPRINLNNQPWSQPVVMSGNTGTVRWQQRLAADWRMVATLGTQRLRTDDRLAFGFGCSAEGNFDRFCSDGTYDLYDFRSENEHRRMDAADIAFSGKLATGGFTHDLTTGLLRSRYKTGLQDYAYNYVGTGNVNGTAVTPADPSTPYANTNRDERSTELYLRDRVQLAPAWSLWAGLRHTRLARSSVDTAGNALDNYQQSFTTPWLALNHEFAPSQIVYVSWGQGIESAVVPNLPGYPNAGQALPALKSRQFEVGVKGNANLMHWSVAAFDIDRPAATDNGTAFFIDGSARHTGLDGTVGAQLGPLNVDAGVLLMHAERRGSQTPSVNGLRPVNVPERTFKLQARYDVDAISGLSLLGGVIYEGDRAALPDNSLSIPAWTRVDLGARHLQKFGNTALTWRVGVDNVFDKRAWREAPFQFGHAYLYPLAPRTWRVSIQADL